MRTTPFLGLTLALLIGSTASAFAGTETMLYSFQGGSDGAGPTSGLIADASGNLYGTTPYGGDLSCSPPGGGAGCGVVYELTPTNSGYVESVLYAFHGGTKDGAVPFGGLVMDGSGDLFGTTYTGGASPCVGEGGCGTVFELKPGGPTGYTESIPYFFQGAGDGAHPSAQLTLDGTGTLYGTTDLGAGTCGGNADECSAAFALTPGNSGYTESVIGVFGISGVALGLSSSSLFSGNSGALYGTAYGAEVNPPFGSIVFELQPSNQGYANVQLAQSSGDNQFVGGVVGDNGGSLYGERYLGGKGCAHVGGCGTIYRISPAGTLASIYDFHGIAKNASSGDGSRPAGGLLLGPGNVLYGTTIAGGRAGCELIKGSTGCGTVFALTPHGAKFTEKILYSFASSGGDGTFPKSSLIIDQNGALYGTTNAGGNGYGTVFKIVP
jgi:hypothetical protein